MSWMLIIYNTAKIIADDHTKSIKYYIPIAIIILNTETISGNYTKTFTSESKIHNNKTTCHSCQHNNTQARWPARDFYIAHLTGKRDQLRITVIEVAVDWQERMVLWHQCGRPLHTLTNNWTHGSS